MTILYWLSLVFGLIQGVVLPFHAPFTGASSPQSRGYVTTPGELATVYVNSTDGIQPYKDAVEGIENFANTGSGSVNPSTATPSYWPYGTISGPQSCSATLEPSFLGNGSPLAESKAIVYNLLLASNPALANQYASNLVAQLNQLSTTTSYGGAVYSGANQCILNLSWYTPGWIIAADLIEGYSGWTATDKTNFQNWLATVVYPKTNWASQNRSNNWGNAGSATSGMIADYLTGSGIDMTDQNGNPVTSHSGYADARQRQLDRIDGQSYMDNTNCGSPGQGIRPDGGIPEELARGAPNMSCNSLAFTSSTVSPDIESWTYTQTALEGLILHAEFLLRRGDNTFFTNVSGTGHGSLQKAYLFVLDNPNSNNNCGTGTNACGWNTPNEIAELEIMYRYYRDPLLAGALGIGGTRLIGTKSGQMLHFGTVFAGFATGENPGLPPTISPP